jgi:hypothetical protein
LLEAEQRKIAQIRAKIARVQEGYEAEIYNTEDAKTHITGYQKAISSSEQEIERLQQPGGDGLTSIDIENLRLELKAFAEKKFEEATFEEKQDIISKLNIKAYPSEDLKTMRVKCGVNFVPEDSDNIQCGKIIFAPARGIRTNDTTYGLKVLLENSAYRTVPPVILDLNLYFHLVLVM